MAIEIETFLNYIKQNQCQIRLLSNYLGEHRLSRIYILDKLTELKIMI